MAVFRLPLSGEYLYWHVSMVRCIQLMLTPCGERESHSVVYCISLYTICMKCVESWNTPDSFQLQSACLISVNHIIVVTTCVISSKASTDLHAIKTATVVKYITGNRKNVWYPDVKNRTRCLFVFKRKSNSRFYIIVHCLVLVFECQLKYDSMRLRIFQNDQSIRGGTANRTGDARHFK